MAAVRQAASQAVAASPHVCDTCGRAGAPTCGFCDLGSAFVPRPPVPSDAPSDAGNCEGSCHRAVAGSHAPDMATATKTLHCERVLFGHPARSCIRRNVKFYIESGETARVTFEFQHKSRTSDIFRRLLTHDTRGSFCKDDITCVQMQDGSADGALPSLLLWGRPRVQPAWLGSELDGDCIVIELAAGFDREALDLLCDAPQLTLTKASELFLLAEKHLLHQRERRVVALEAARASLDRREQSLDLRQTQLEAKEKEVVRERIQVSDERRRLMDAEQLLEREIFTQWSAMAHVETDHTIKETQTDEATTHKATRTEGENFVVNPEGMCVVCLGESYLNSHNFLGESYLNSANPSSSQRPQALRARDSPSRPSDLPRVRLNPWVVEKSQIWHANVLVNT